MAMVSPAPEVPSREQHAPAAALFHSLSDPTRLEIVGRLNHGEARVADLAAELALSQSTVSTHHACLRDSKLVTYSMEGRQSFYRLAEPALTDLLAAGERLLEATARPSPYAPCMECRHE